jgi:hypothetical protein
MLDICVQFIFALIRLDIDADRQAVNLVHVRKIALGVVIEIFMYRAFPIITPYIPIVARP